MAANGRVGAAKQRLILFGKTARRRRMDMPIYINAQRTNRDLAQAVRLFEDRLENRRKIAWIGIDDLQHFGSRGLLFQQPRAVQ